MTVRRISALLIFFAIAATAKFAFAHELGVFGKTRPAVSQEADEKIKVFRSFGREAGDALSVQATTDKLRKLCPKEYSVIDRIFSRIRSTSPIEGFLRDYPVAVWVWCDSKDDKSGATKFRLNGVLEISGS